MAQHLIALPVTDLEDATFLKHDIIDAAPGLWLIGFTGNPYPKGVYTARIIAETDRALERLAAVLGVDSRDIVEANLLALSELA